MTIEIHGGYKPSFVWRARIVPVILLFVTLALAGHMTWDRTHDRLGARVRPAGWELSFRPPRGFAERPPVAGQTPNVYHLWGSTRRRAAVILVIRRLTDMADVPADMLAETILEKDTLIKTSDGHLSSFEQTQEPIGPFAGTQILAAHVGTVVRAGISPDGVAYALTLHFPNHQIDDGTYLLFQQMCRSVETH